jgi:hypothetical protein
MMEPRTTIWRPPDKKMGAREHPAPLRQLAKQSHRNHTCRAGRPPCKWRRVLQALYDGRTLNRFEAARELRDSSLNSTVAALEARGLRIERRDEVIPGYEQAPTRCRRYWLSPVSRDRARELLECTNA